MDRPGRGREAEPGIVRTRSLPSRPVFHPLMEFPTRQALRETQEGHDTKRAAIGRRSADITRLGAARAHSPQDRRERDKHLRGRTDELSRRRREQERARSASAYARRRKGSVRSKRPVHRGGSPKGRR